MSQNNALRIIRQIGGDDEFAQPMAMPPPHEEAGSHGDIARSNRASVETSLRTVDSAIELLRGMGYSAG